MKGLMKPKIHNAAALTAVGDTQSRKLVLEVTQAILGRLYAYDRIRGMLKRDGPLLHIGEKTVDLSAPQHIYFIGAGKACNAMAMAIEEILGEWLTDGIAVVKIFEKTDRFGKIRAFVGGHPIPNEEGLKASLAIEQMIEGSVPGDLFFCAMSGGSSALMSCPAAGISLRDEMETTDVLLKSGAGIREINAVRRHISRMNGGRMAELIARRGGRIIGFNISDAVTNPPTSDITVPWKNFSATPMGPDFTTLADARQVIRDYALENRLPESVTTYLFSDDPSHETPKAFPHNLYYQINTLPDSCVYAAEIAAARGIPSMVLTTYLEGEAKDAGMFMAAVAHQIQRYGQPVKAPCMVFSAGEVVTTIADSSRICGHGGPSQEMALGFALAARDIPGACFLSIDSEGTDGTTCAAGGISDSKTAGLAAAQGLDLHEALREHAAYELLCSVNGAVMTGNTGTNICDINVLYVPEAQAPAAVQLR